MGKSRELGMRTFDWALFELYNEGHIGYDDAIRNADSANELRLNIKLKSERGEPAAGSGVELSLHAMEEALPAEDEGRMRGLGTGMRRREAGDDRASAGGGSDRPFLRPRGRQRGPRQAPGERACASVTAA